MKSEDHLRQRVHGQYQRLGLILSELTKTTRDAWKTFNDALKAGNHDAMVTALKAVIDLE